MRISIGFSRMLRAASSGAFVAIALFACGDLTETEFPTPNLTGKWDFTALTTVVGTGAVCADTGTLTLVQTVTTVIGAAEYSRTCTSAQPYDAKDSVSAGAVSHNTFNLARRFAYATSPSCLDTAVISGASSENMNGTGTCGTATKTWKARRGAAVASIVIAPSTLVAVKGGTASFSAVTRNAAGVRIFSRPIAWSSSDDAIATIDATGQLVARGAGTATITATSETKSASEQFFVSADVALQKVSAGNAATCALNAVGFVYCWGRIAARTSSKVPSLLQTAVQFAQVSVGDDFICGVSATNLPYCWGKNDDGQLGTGLPNGTTLEFPGLLAGGIQLTTISAGLSHACGLAPSGVAYCWGSNTNGQLGSGNTTSSNVPVLVGGGRTYSAINAGGRHTCATALDGTMFCWGANDVGQIGDGTALQRTVPTASQTALRWNAVDAARNSTCALAANGDAYCWGENYAGQLGNGSQTNQLAPTKILNGFAFSAISLGHNHACALTAAGAVYCWGTNSWGQLGDGTTVQRLTAVRVSGEVLYKSISSGYYTFSDEAVNEGTAEHTCAVSTANVTYCWGVNLIGQLGIGAPQRLSVNAPTKVAGQP